MASSHSSGDRKAAAHETLHAYYRDQGVLPTHGAFRSLADLKMHDVQRRRLFTDKLYLPPRVFQGADLLEYGPDSGENSLVFALWGANCTLVEPNPKARPAIKNYFERFGLADRLAGLEEADIAQYAKRGGTLKKFDIIDAEGFIYTVKPDSLWIDLFARQVAEGGLVVLFYYEKYGSFLELLPKVLQAWLRARTGMASLDAAKALFETKWNSIPHKRPMQSWVMDVLENPFVRLRYFYEPQDLCRKMEAKDFTLYSSWPPYRDAIEVHWFKKIPSRQEALASREAFLVRSRLSHMFGRTLFMTGIDPALERTLSELLEQTDSLIDAFDGERARQCTRALSHIKAVIPSTGVLASTDDKAEVVRMLDSAQAVFSLLIAGDAEALVRFCNSDEAFIRAWGMPSHFAVFRHESGLGR